MIYQITRVYLVPGASKVGAKNRLNKALATGWAHTYLIEESIEEQKRPSKSLFSEIRRQLSWLFFGTKRR